MWIYIITGVVTWFSYKVFNSYICKILAGFLWVTTGIYRITIDPAAWDYIITGTILVAIGIYIMIMVGVDYFGER